VQSSFFLSIVCLGKRSARRMAEAVGPLEVRRDTVASGSRDAKKRGENAAVGVG
jgi:hypothetical protein